MNNLLINKLFNSLFVKPFFNRLSLMLYKIFSLPLQVNEERKSEEYLVTKNYSTDKTCKLTPDEIQRVERLWGSLVDVISLKEYEMYKKMCGFDERFLTHFNYLPLIARRLNDYHYTKFFEDKGLLGFLVPNELKFPICYVRCINGEYYNNEMAQISKYEALNICVKQDSILVKPSKDSSGGKGIRIIRLSECNEKERHNLVLDILENYGKDYVLQQVIKQHPLISRFNDTSVNTFRVITLYLNGEFSVLSIILRIGQKGSVVDNLSSGGLMVAIDEDGKMHNEGMTLNLERKKSYNGIILGEQRIDFMPHILQRIKCAHEKSFPLCKFIGWDVCIDKDGQPIVIEVNSSQPGVRGSQVLTGPIFGNRTQEVIDYCKKKPFFYNKALLRY